MKYIVKDGPKSSKPVSARRIVGMYRKGLISADAEVINEKGKSRPILSFVLRIEARGDQPTLDHSTPEEFTAVEDEPESIEEDEGVVPDWLSDTNLGGPDASGFEPAEHKSLESSEVLKPASNQPEFFPSARYEAAEPQRSKKNKTGAQSSLASKQECAFPGGLLALLIKWLEDLSESWGNSFQQKNQSGIITGIFYVIGFLFGVVSMITLFTKLPSDRWALNLVAMLLMIFSLAAVTIFSHYANVKILQLQPRLLQPQYIVSDRGVVQIVIGFLATALLLVCVWFFAGVIIAPPNSESLWEVLQTILSGVILLVLCGALVVRMSSVKTLGIVENSNATATETLLGVLAAINRLPLLVNSTSHLAGVLLYVIITVDITLSMLQLGGSVGYLPTLLTPLLFTALAYPFISSISSLVGGAGIEALRALLSIESEIRELRINTRDSLNSDSVDF